MCVCVCVCARARVCVYVRVGWGGESLGHCYEALCTLSPSSPTPFIYALTD